MNARFVLKVQEVDANADGSKKVMFATQIAVSDGATEFVQPFSYGNFSITLPKDSPLINSFSPGATVPFAQ